MSWLTVLHSLAYLSRCRFASRSSSEKPSSICTGREDKLLLEYSKENENSDLSERVFLVPIIANLIWSHKSVKGGRLLVVGICSPMIYQITEYSTEESVLGVPWLQEKEEKKNTS